GGQQSEKVEPAVEGPTLEPDSRQDRVLAEKTAGQGQPGKTGTPCQERPEGEGYPFLKPPHFKDVLLMVHGGNHAPRSEEEEGLEEGMNQKMEGSGGDGAGAHPEHHVADLADGGIGQCPLQVALGQGAGGGVECGQPAGQGDGGHGNG